MTYWYFTFANTEKQNLRNCLCSIIADIFSNREDVPEAIELEYERANNGQQQPTMATLLDMFKELVLDFDNIYIILDGLDEVPNSADGGGRDDLLKLIHRIRGIQVKPLHFFMTSRREIDITESFMKADESLGVLTIIQAEGSEVEVDIKKYLQHRLQEKVFHKWSTDLKQLVSDTLAFRAQGM